MARGEIVPFHVGLAEEGAHLLDERKPTRQYQPKKEGGPGRSTPRADVLAWLDERTPPGEEPSPQLKDKACEVHGLKSRRTVNKYLQDRREGRE